MPPDAEPLTPLFQFFAIGFLPAAMMIARRASASVISRFFDIDFLPIDIFQFSSPSRRLFFRRHYLPPLAFLSFAIAVCAFFVRLSARRRPRLPPRAMRSAAPFTPI
jgi:predicted permease